MQFLRALCSALFVVFICSIYTNFARAEPRCNSRYDFESKLLHNSIKLEFEMTNLREKYEQDIESLKSTIQAALTKLETLSGKLEEEQKIKIMNMETLGEQLQNTMNGTIKNLESGRKTMEEDFADLYKTLHDKNDVQLKELQSKLEPKPTVVFISKDVTNKSPGTNDILIFPSLVTNIGDAYDPSTGYFTAPVSGTYSFTVQICLSHIKHIHIMVYMNEELINNAMNYDADGASPCETFNTFAYVQQGDRVCVKIGLGKSSGTIIYHSESYRWTMFMGALVH